MKLEEAIEIFKKEEEDTFTGSEKKWKEAIQLGIEALKIILACRADEDINLDAPLPGEPED